MLDKAINLYEASIVALDWVENYGGMTKLVNKEGNTANYPVAINANFTDCFTNEVYTKMIPNDKVKSILYYEETSKPKTYQKIVQGNHVVDVIEGGARVVGYVNLANCGFDTWVISLGSITVSYKVCNYIFSYSYFFQTIPKLIGFEFSCMILTLSCFACFVISRTCFF